MVLGKDEVRGLVLPGFYWLSNGQICFPDLATNFWLLGFREVARESGRRHCGGSTVILSSVLHEAVGT